MWLDSSQKFSEACCGLPGANEEKRTLNSHGGSDRSHNSQKPSAWNAAVNNSPASFLQWCAAMSVQPAVCQSCFIVIVTETTRLSVSAFIGPHQAINLLAVTIVVVTHKPVFHRRNFYFWPDLVGVLLRGRCYMQKTADWWNTLEFCTLYHHVYANERNVVATTGQID